MSLEYKVMSMRELKCYMWNLVEGKAMKMVLVGWKYWEMIYYLTSDCNRYLFQDNTGWDNRAPKPNSYIEIQKLHGGADLEYMRRLHLNAAVMRQYQWWLKLLFYFLYVGTKFF